jgi:hypothetical protein
VAHLVLAPGGGPLDGEVHGACLSLACEQQDADYLSSLCRAEEKEPERREDRPRDGEYGRERAAARGASQRARPCARSIRVFAYPLQVSD